MDDNKKFRRKNPFFDMFSEFDKIDEMMDQMMKNAFKNMKPGKPLNYGFSMKIGPDGKPKIREFGNIQPKEQKIEVRDEREPLVDVIDHEKEIDVLAELPGVEKNEIDLNVVDSKLQIKVPGKFFKEVKLPEPVEENAVAEYNNGVLTAKLKKKNLKKKRIEVK